MKPKEILCKELSKKIASKEKWIYSMKLHRRVWFTSVFLVTICSLHTMQTGMYFDCTDSSNTRTQKYADSAICVLVKVIITLQAEHDLVV